MDHAQPPATPPRMRRQRDVDLQQVRRARRVARYEAVVARHAQGWSLRAIAAELRLNRTTVRRFIQASRAGGFPERRPRAPQPPMVAPFDTYLRERWAAGCHNAQALWRELRARGFTGGKSTVRDYVQPWRVPAPRQARAQRRHAAVTAPGVNLVPDAMASNAPSSVRAVTWLLLRRPDELATEDRDLVTALSRQCLDIGVAYGLVQDFASLIRERERWLEDRGALASWVRVATASGLPELASFAAGLRRDWAAVQAALTSPWSNGQTEGQVSRLKMLKRQMFGRAKFDLLRKRVLARC